MKKQIFIIIGGVIVLILLAVWGYLFFFGTPGTADEVFSDLGLQGSEDGETGFVPLITTEEEPLVNMERDKLRQLTTKNVAGFRHVNISTSTPAFVYYVEMGTGHVFSIDLVSGEEKRISGTTVPKAFKAQISATGDYVAIASAGNSKSLELTAGTLSTSSEMLLPIFNKTVMDFSIGDKNELLYTEVQGTELVGSSYNLVSNKTTNIFSVPFREATVEWGRVASGPHYIFPKATYALEGFLYEASAGSLNRLPLSGFGFSAKGNDDIILYNQSVKQTPKSFIYDKVTKTSKPLDAAVIPEKCLFLKDSSEFMCPFDSITLPYESPDEWYKGSLSFKDSFWLLDASNMSGRFIVDTFEESGREIDVINLTSSPERNVLYFNNKNDNTLWMYEL